MLSNLHEFWKELCTKGIHLPFSFDPETKQPSVTLGFFYITSFLSIISLILLHLNYVTLAATGMSLVFVLVGFVMYRLRKLDKVKIDVKNESVDLEDNEETKKQGSKDE